MTGFDLHVALRDPDNHPPFRLTRTGGEFPHLCPGPGCAIHRWVADGPARRRQLAQEPATAERERRPALAGVVGA